MKAILRSSSPPPSPPPSSRRRSSSASRSARTASSPTTSRSSRTFARWRRRRRACESRRSARPRSAKTSSWPSITSEENMQNLERSGRSRSKLADPRGLSRRADRRSSRATASHRAGHLQHSLDGDRVEPDGDGVGARAGHRERCRDQAPPRQRHPAARAVAQSRRPDHGHRLVPQIRRHALRGRPAAVALPPLRRPRQQSRLVHAHADRDEEHEPRRLPRVVSAGLASTSTRWAPTDRACSSRRSPIRSIPTSIR